MPPLSMPTQIQVKRLIRPLENRLKRLLQELVRTNSVAIPPDGNETAAQKVLWDFFHEQGIRSELYELDSIQPSGKKSLPKRRNYKGRKNLEVVITGSGRGRTLILNGHIDTVPAGTKAWSRSPWSGMYRSGKIHGLGSFDMKGGVVSNAAVVVALARSGVRLGGDIMFESVVDEEWGGGGGTLAARSRRRKADACVVAEGTQLEIYRASRGGHIVDLTVSAGDSTAYFSKSQRTSPAIPLGRLLGWIDGLSRQRRELKSSGPYGTFPDPVPVQVLAIESNRIDPQIPFSVPTEATVRLYLQFLPEEDIGSVIREIKRSLSQFERSDPFFAKYPTRWTSVTEQPLHGHELPKRHPWTHCMIESATVMLGKAPSVTAAPYPCDAGLIQSAFEIPTLIFGPRGGGAHNPDEYVEFDSVIEAAEVLLAAALSWTR